MLTPSGSKPQSFVAWKYISLAGDCCLLMVPFAPASLLLICVLPLPAMRTGDDGADLADDGGQDPAMVMWSSLSAATKAKMPNKLACFCKKALWWSLRRSLSIEPYRKRKQYHRGDVCGRPDRFTLFCIVFSMFTETVSCNRMQQMLKVFVQKHA